MPERLEVSPNSRPGDRFAVVVAKYNSDITDRLCQAALTTLTQHGVADNNIVVVPVPGSFEISLVANRLAHSGKFDAVVCLGAVIQGETTHHEYINHQVAEGISNAAVQSGVPVAFGVLTCQNLELALDRAGGKMGNKGHEAALAALETLATLRAIDEVGTNEARNEREEATGTTETAESAETTETAETENDAQDDEDTETGEMLQDRPDPRRRRARETALQALYQVDINPDMPPAALVEFLDSELGDPQLRAFAGQIVKGVTTRRNDLDDRIQSHSDNWSLNRMAGTDRNIIRLATWELLYSDVPFRVILDEAVELAKTFGDARSPDFVNGVLDALVPETRRVQA
jgi:6,7-dimethyl-8-ribityllumazine synthase